MYTEYIVQTPRTYMVVLSCAIIELHAGVQQSVVIMNHQEIVQIVYFNPVS